MFQSVRPGVAFLGILLPLYVSAQLEDDFSDGNFFSDPVWSGDTAQFNITAEELQSDGPEASETLHIVSGQTMSGELEWRFQVRLEFDPSSSNYTRVYLFSDTENLEGDLNGYYIQLGEAAAPVSDSIDFYRQDGATSVKLYTAPEVCISSTTNNTVNFRVLRDSSGTWEIRADCSGGSDYTAFGSFHDATYSSTHWFGFLVKHTSTRNDKFFFDNIYVGPHIVDTIPPAIIEVSVYNSTTLDLKFSESLQSDAAENTGNYIADNLIGNPMTACLDAEDHSAVQLNFYAEFPDGLTNTLTVSGIVDQAGNIMNLQNEPFFWYSPEIFDVIISEFLADESPSAGLPQFEFVELLNRTPFRLNLQNWKLQDGSGSEGAVLPDIEIGSGEYIVLCPSGAQDSFAVYGTAFGLTGWPLLNNPSDVIQLTDPDENTIHRIAYSDTWYRDEEKSDGGWSLEMINPNKPFLASCNWKAAVDDDGGTPGMQNSVDGDFEDVDAPYVTAAFALDTVTIKVIFNEGMDSSMLAEVTNYKVADFANVIDAIPTASEFSEVELTIDRLMEAGVLYKLTVEDVADCAGNLTGLFEEIYFGIPEQPEVGEIVINEILYNPKGDGKDYIELLNRTDKIFDLSDLHIIEADPFDPEVIKDEAQLSSLSQLILPFGYLALTADDQLIRQAYPQSADGQIISVADFPAWNDSDQEGIVVLEFRNGSESYTVDEVRFSEDWHFALIDDAEGVSLERINPSGESAVASNWTSAAAATGYGTPGKVNSNFTDISAGAFIGEVALSSQTFSPDQDGFEDVVVLSFSLDDSGYAGSLSVFDAWGREVRRLVQVQQLGHKGQFSWDGINEDGQKAKVGIYVLHFDVFDLDGNRKQFKEPVVLAGYLN